MDAKNTAMSEELPSGLRSPAELDSHRRPFARFSGTACVGLLHEAVDDNPSNTRSLRSNSGLCVTGGNPFAQPLQEHPTGQRHNRIAKSRGMSEKATQQPRRQTAVCNSLLILCKSLTLAGNPFSFQLARTWARGARASCNPPIGACSAFFLATRRGKRGLRWSVIGL